MEAQALVIWAAQQRLVVLVVQQELAVLLLLGSLEQVAMEQLLQYLDRL
jgi:hypothetical protein